MGDGKVRRHAILINTDTEERHIQNIGRAATALKEGAYEVHALNPQSLGNDRYQIPTRQDLDAIVQGLQIDDDDQLVIYYTGHGLDSDAVDDGKRISQDFIYQTTGNLPHGQRTIIMDACYTGNSAERWHNDKTLFISPDWKGRQVACQLFAPNLWESSDVLIDKSADTNADGIISMQERFAYTSRVYKKEFPSALPIYLKGKVYSDIGFGDKTTKVAFPKGMIIVKTAKDLRDQLSKLRAGQFAVVTFASDWCPACSEYLPVFTELAKRQDGSILNLWIQPKNETETKLIFSKYGVSEIPAVILIDHGGRFIEARDRNNPLNDIFRLTLSDKVILDWAIEKFNGGEFNALNHICMIAINNPEMMTLKGIRAIIKGVEQSDPYSAQTLMFLIRKQPNLFGSNRDKIFWKAKGVYDRYAIAQVGYQRAMKFYRQRNYDDAITFFRGAIQSFPKFAPAHHMLGVIFCTRGDYERGIYHHRRAYEINPNIGAYALNLFETYIELNEMEKARPIIDTIFSRDKDSVLGHYMLGGILFREGDYEESFKHVNIAYNSRSELTKPLAAQLTVLRGLLFQFFGNRAEAKRHYLEAHMMDLSNRIASRNFNLMELPIDKIQIDTGIRLFPSSIRDTMGVGLKVSTRWPLIVETPILRLAPRYAVGYTGYNQDDDSKNWIGLSAGLELEFIHRLLRFNFSADAGYDFQVDAQEEDPVGRVMINQGFGIYYKANLNVEVGLLGEFQYRVGDPEAMNIFFGPSLLYRAW